MNTEQNRGQPGQAAEALKGQMTARRHQLPRPALAPPAQLCLDGAPLGGCCLYVYMNFSPRTDHRPMDAETLGAGFLSSLGENAPTRPWDSSV